jgi:hypothetical protein
MNTTVKRILMDGLLTTFLQIVFYSLLLFAGWTLMQLIHDPTNEEIYEFNFGAELSIVFLGLPLLAANLLFAIINRRFWTRAAIIVLTSILVIGWIRDFKHSNLLSSLLTVALILTIISKFAIEKLVLLIIKKINSGFVPNQP